MAQNAEHTAYAAHDASAHDMDSHGHSTAAWTGVCIMLVGAALICLGMILMIVVLWAVGILVFLAGALAWPLLNRAGYGDGGPKNKMGH